MNSAQREAITRIRRDMAGAGQGRISVLLKRSDLDALLALVTEQQDEIKDLCGELGDMQDVVTWSGIH